MWKIVSDNRFQRWYSWLVIWQRSASITNEISVDCLSAGTNHVSVCLDWRLNFFPVQTPPKNCLKRDFSAAQLAPDTVLHPSETREPRTSFKSSSRWVHSQNLLFQDTISQLCNSNRVWKAAIKHRALRIHNGNRFSEIGRCCCCSLFWILNFPTKIERKWNKNWAQSKSAKSLKSAT